MFIKLKVKTERYLRVPIQDIPFEAYTPEGWKQGLYLSYLLTDTEYMANVNTTELVINSDCIKEVFPFNDSIVTNCYPHNKHLIGTGAIVILKTGRELFVANRFKELSIKLNAV